MMFKLVKKFYGDDLSRMYKVWNAGNLYITEDLREFASKHEQEIINLMPDIFIFYAQQLKHALNYDVPYEEFKNGSIAGFFKISIDMVFTSFKMHIYEHIETYIDENIDEFINYAIKENKWNTN